MLNFFEFLAGLRKLGQVSKREIQILFDDDLRMLRQHDFVMAVLEPPSVRPQRAGGTRRG